MTPWTDVLSMTELPLNSKRLIAVQVGPTESLQPARLLAVHGEDGEVWVVDGRCPHEGYPLSDGVVDGCVLTCTWHNWKFDLRSGDNTLGGEGLRRWPSRVVGGRLEVDLRGPDPAAARDERLRSLHEALDEGRLGQGLRDALRLTVGGMDAARVCAEIARHDALHAEWGTTHTLPVAADCARLAAEVADPHEALSRIAPALDIEVDGNARLALRNSPSEKQRKAARELLAEGKGAALLRWAIEGEEPLAAEALIRESDPGAHEAWLLHCIAGHFTDFGHQLIYLQKLRELRLRLGEAADAELLTDLAAGLAVSLTYATREDALPYLRRWFAQPLPPLRGGGTPELGRLQEALRRGARVEVLSAMTEAIEAGAEAGAVADRILLAGAYRLEHFDEAIGDDPTVDEDWLSASHRMTAALAIGELLRHLPCSAEDASALLLQGAAFVSLGHATDRATLPPRREVGPDWRAPLMEMLLNDRFVRPIRLAHGVKTLVAAEDARVRLHALDPDAPVHAVRRLFEVRAKERRLRGQVHNSVRWLRDGKPPKRLTQ